MNRARSIKNSTVLQDDSDVTSQLLCKASTIQHLGLEALRVRIPDSECIGRKRRKTRFISMGWASASYAYKPTQSVAFSKPTQSVAFSLILNTTKPRFRLEHQSIACGRLITTPP